MTFNEISSQLSEAVDTVSEKKAALDNAIKEVNKAKAEYDDAVQGAKGLKDQMTQLLDNVFGKPQTERIR